MPIPAKLGRCRMCNAQVIWATAKHNLCQGRGCKKCNDRGWIKVPLDYSAPVFGIPQDASFSEPHVTLPEKIDRRWFVSHFVTCPRLRQAKEPYGDIGDV